MANKRLFVFIWLILGIFLVLVGRDFLSTIPEIGSETLFTSRRAKVLLLYVLITLVIWIQGWRYSIGGNPPTFKILHYSQDFAGRWPVWARWFLAVGLTVLLPVVMFFGPTAYELTGIWIQLAILMTVAGAANFMVNPRISLVDWIHKYFVSIILVSVVYFSGSLLTGANSYPFSIGWSDGNRLWDFSVHIGADRYLVPEGVTLRAFVSPFREMLNGLVYFIPNVGIFGVRLWIILLQIAPLFLLGRLLVSANKNFNVGRSGVILFSAWTFLFLFQGPIQARLVVCAVVMVLGARSKNLLLAVILVMASGYLAFYSRWTWAYAPGLWAGMLALLQENNPTFKREDWGKLTRPIILGISGFFGGKILPTMFKPPGDWGFESGVTKVLEVSSRVASTEALYWNQWLPRFTFNQPLLWDRWLPNPTFPPGIFLALLAAISPLIILLILANKYGKFKPNRLQIFGVSSTLFLFLIVGLVASTKIGGGGDLHNMDMFLIGLIIFAAWGWPYILQMLKDRKHKPLLALAVYVLLSVPVLTNLSFHPKGPPQIPSEEVVNQSLSAIRKEVLAVKELGEVLFMDQRQLLTFGNIANVSMVIEYEKKFVMDMAMASNAAYFDKFYEDLENHRFVLIISEPLILYSENASKPFMEENDVWIKWVSTPMLQYYRVLAYYPEVRVQLLVPRINLPSSGE